MDDSNVCSKDPTPHKDAQAQGSNTHQQAEEIYETTVSTKQASPAESPRASDGGMGSSTGHSMSKYLKEKEREWSEVAKKEGPRRLLDLPLDVIQDILKEVRFRP